MLRINCVGVALGCGFLAAAAFVEGQLGWGRFGLRISDRQCSATSATQAWLAYWTLVTFDHMWKEAESSIVFFDPYRLIIWKGAENSIGFFDDARCKLKQKIPQ